MKIFTKIFGKLAIAAFFSFFLSPCSLPASDLFFADEPVIDDIDVAAATNTFAEIFQKLDNVNWAGKSVGIAIESLENISPAAHIAATDDRIVLVWRDTIIANFPKPAKGDWREYGQIATALVLKMRANDPDFGAETQNGMYRIVVDALVRGIDENGRYVFSRDAEITEGGRILTSAGIDGVPTVDGILITGGIAYNKLVTNYIKNMTEFIAPVFVYPGEDEMAALAGNVQQALEGKLPMKKYA